jgi:exosome complex component RRP4
MLHSLFVGATAADALAIGYRTVLIDDCSRGVDLKDIEKTKNTVTSNNGVIVDSSQVSFLTQCRELCISLQNVLSLLSLLCLQ